MEFTGERVIPGEVDADLFNEHFARYRYAERFVKGRRVLDAGCGAGYGSAALARSARKVWAADNAWAAVSRARRDAETSSVGWLQASCAALPLGDSTVDIVTAFEVIEHLAEWREFLAEARRVLRPDGLLLVSTPNRPVYEESREGPNPFHVHEFDYPEFQTALEAVFPHVAICLENHVQAIAVGATSPAAPIVALEKDRAAPTEAHFFLAVCSQRPLPELAPFIYVPETSNVLRERERHIRLLEGELEQKGRWLVEAQAEVETLAKLRRHDQLKAQQTIDRLDEEIREKNRWAEEADRAVEAARARIAAVEQDLEERLQWVRQAQAESAERLEELLRSNAKIDELEARVTERTEWAQGLDRELEQARAELAALYASWAYRVGRRLRLAPERAAPRPESPATFDERRR